MDEGVSMSIVFKHERVVQHWAMLAKANALPFF